MDYYKDYIEYASEIDEACSCVNSNHCSNLNADIEAIVTAVNGLNLSSIWPDGVGGTFKSVIETTKGCLNDISSSISSLFVESEEIYLNQKEQLLSLKDANTRYMNKRDNEKPSTDDFEVSAEYENGVLVKEGYFRQSDYDSAIVDWRKKVQALEDKCINLKNKIEKNKTRLFEINSETVMSSGNFSTLEMKYGDVLNASLDSILELAAANGISLLTYSNWGEDFYVLADITSGDKQDPDKCLDWANGYASTLLDKVKKNNDYLDSRTNPIAYESKDWHETLKITANELLQGRPVVVEVQGTKVGEQDPITIQYEKDGKIYQEVVDTATRHYVMIYGIKKDANINNLQESDFLYLDPAMGEVKHLGVGYEELGLMERHLLPANADINKNESGYYNINVFSDNVFSNNSEYPTTTLKNKNGMVGTEKSPHHDFTSSNVFTTNPTTYDV